jgi:predicted acetyltransferase
MITRLETSEEIVPLFKEYLGVVSRFYTIYDFDSWCEGAVKNLQTYSMAEDRLIYVLKESETFIGFALVNKHLRFNSGGFGIADFYIQKSHGRNGHGRRLAEHVFERFPGSWEVAVSLKNEYALGFWKQVVLTYTSGRFMEKKHASFKGYGFLFNNQ